MRKLVALIASLAVLAGTAAIAGAAPHKIPPIPPVAGVWSHDDLNRKINGKWHTLTLDNGRVVQSSAAQLTLREPDGSVVVIPLSADTVFGPPRFAAFPPALRRGLHAVTMRIDGGPAVRVRLSPRA